LNNDPPVEVILARTWTITARTPLALLSRTILVALQDFVLDGKISIRSADVTEPGLGGTGSFSVGAGGGSFCGQGGIGAYSSLARAPAYGTADLIPPRVGSAGGNTTFLQSGPGGGFLQIVAGGSLRVGATGVIFAGGGGGYDGGGGGSGGALLLEALSVSIQGVLAANGGGGGSANQDGQTATATATRAAGGKDSLGNVVGGAGAAGGVSDGDDAQSISVTSGGGGGAGRIRINTAAGQASLTGILSPAPSTPCATQGLVRAL
jgi:hypothetical protein